MSTMSDDILGIPMSMSSSPSAEPEVTEPSSPGQPKTTPRKRTIKETQEVDDEEFDEAPKRKKAKSAKSEKKKKRSPTKTPTNSRTIPRSYGECSEADKKLINMRDAGTGWTEIRAEWEKITGEKAGTSTLPNRYQRLKNNFTVIKEEDNAKMIEAKMEVEAAFEKEKWNLIAKAVVNRGGDSYKGEALNRQYKKLMLEHGVAPPPNVKDKDFEIELEEDDDDE